MSCRQCLHWKRIDLSAVSSNPPDVGSCRRHPPRVSDKLLMGRDPDQIMRSTVWPITAASQGCGEEENSSPC